MPRNTVAKTSVALLLAGAGAAVQAAPIVGSFGFTGNFAPLGGTAANTATGIDFVGTGPVSACSNNYVAIFASAGLTCGFGPTAPLATLGDIPIGSLPLSGASAFSQLNWINVNGGLMTFDLGSITSITRSADTNTSLQIAGLGTARTTVSGFDATRGTFILTLNGRNAGEFTFSGSGTTTGVPEPASLALMGLALAGMGLARRRKV